MKLYDSRRKEQEQSTLLDLIAKKNDLVPTQEILNTHNLTAGQNHLSLASQGNRSDSSESSGLFYDIPTPGASNSDLTIA